MLDLPLPFAPTIAINLLASRVIVWCPYHDLKFSKCIAVIRKDIKIYLEWVIFERFDILYYAKHLINNLGVNMVYLNQLFLI